MYDGTILISIRKLCKRSNQTPEDAGFRAEMNWTSPLVRCWIKQEWGIEYSDRCMRALMYALNLSYTRPTYTLKKADPVKQEES